MSAVTGAALSLISRPDVFGDSTFATQLREAVIAAVAVPADIPTASAGRPTQPHRRSQPRQRREGRPPIAGVTNHSLRRTFCALMYEVGATPAYVMGQMGHTDASLALEVYAKVMERKRETGARTDELIRGAGWLVQAEGGIVRTISVAPSPLPQA